MKKEQIERIIRFLERAYKRYVSETKHWEANWCRRQIEDWQKFSQIIK